MTETPRLSLPLIQAAQAQKHVTVNEAMVRLDGLTQLVLQSVSISVPPGVASDGDCYAVPLAASGNWAGQESKIALYSNGGWIFLTPEIGWRAWVVDASSPAIFGAPGWILGAVALSANGAAMVHEIVEVDHMVMAGPTVLVADAIPGGVIVFGVTGRVLQTMSGALDRMETWRCRVRRPLRQQSEPHGWELGEGTDERSIDLLQRSGSFADGRGIGLCRWCGSIVG